MKGKIFAVLIVALLVFVSATLAAEEITVENGKVIAVVSFEGVGDTAWQNVFRDYSETTFYAISSRTGRVLATGKDEGGKVTFIWNKPESSKNFRERVFYQATDSRYQGNFWAKLKLSGNKYLVAQHANGKVDRSQPIDYGSIADEFIISPSGEVSTVPDGSCWHMLGEI